jgi:PelA/Pel-15E family pectate lyase
MTPGRNCLRIVFSLAAALVLSSAVPAPAQSADWKTFAEKPDDWYRSPEGWRVTTNILTHQSELGSWPKNIDTTEEPYKGDRRDLHGTFDNHATIGELRYLARAYRATKDPALVIAFHKGLDHIIAAQYPNGGWPQSYPPGNGYARYITFNDGTMINLLEFVRDVSSSPDFAFVNEPRRQAAAHAFHAGVDCILRCQIKVDGTLTVWCAQHDEKTLEPRPARKFEPVSLSGGESAGILRLLMSLDSPSPEIRQAVHSAIQWYESARLTGIRETRVKGDKVIVADKNAPPLWARFYQIGTNRPIFSGRDSVIKYDIAEIEPERRNGYAWYGTWGRDLDRLYAKWKEKWETASR